MMRVLWVPNTPVGIRDVEGQPTYSGGWVQGALNGLLRYCPEVKLVLVSFEEIPIQWIEQKSVEYIHISYDIQSRFVSKRLEKQAIQTLKKYRPDIIHIWGTEFPHSFVFLKAAQILGMVDRVVVNIQGLVSVIAEHYFANIPKRYLGYLSLSAIYHRSSLKTQQKIFKLKGEIEKKVIRNVANVIGRTYWDEGCVELINPSINYYFCNETLRSAFYCNEKWDIEKCQRNTIFISQCYYPIKGMHVLFKAFPLILKRFPDATIIVAGIDRFRRNGKIKKICNPYDQYLISIARKYGFLDKIVFIGNLPADKMKESFLRAHVFVSPSIIENESNSLSEARILGTPSVASYVGGVIQRIHHGNDGFFFPWNEYYMLAYYICKIFSDDSLAMRISQNSRKNQMIVNDEEINAKKMKKIYSHIIARGKE